MDITLCLGEFASFGRENTLHPSGGAVFLQAGEYTSSEWRNCLPSGEETSHSNLHLLSFGFIRAEGLISRSASGYVDFNISVLYISFYVED